MAIQLIIIDEKPEQLKLAINVALQDSLPFLNSVAVFRRFLIVVRLCIVAGKYHRPGVFVSYKI